ncbi:MAG: hypothetical protein KDC92_15435, partial [Bacteroidetes bacterium]|nr:hypothetical protein [Bacteroidota bacterium]
MKKISFVFLLANFICTTQSFATTYYSQTSGDPGSTSNWNSVRAGGGSAPSNFTTGSDVFVIQNGHTMTTTAIWDLGGSSMTLQIEDGGILQADNEVDLTPSSIFQIDNGGTYYHNFSTAEIFDGTESFGASSTVELQTRPAATFSVLSFGNLIINYSSGGNMRFNAGNTGTITIAGDLTIKNTSSSGADEVRCATGSSTSVTLDIAGDFNITGGTFNFFSASGGFGSIEVGGDVNFTGGTWNNTGSDNLTFNFTNDQINTTATFNGVNMSGAEANVDYN